MSAPMLSSSYAPQQPRIAVPRRKPHPQTANVYPSMTSASMAPHPHDTSPRGSIQHSLSYNPMTPMASNSTRRTLSNATTSTTSSGPSHQNSMRRSSSGRSTGPSPTSYVALLRKQKATVWCDRSQAEDPRIRIQQRLAKERAEREVVAGPHGQGRSTPPAASSAGGSFTGGVARKIRHHGGKPVQYTGGNMAGAGVPLRLSATEVEDEGQSHGRSSTNVEDLNEWERDPAWGYAGQRSTLQQHHRSGSGRSSLGSQRRGGGSAYPPRFGTSSSTPTSGHSRSPSETQLQNLAEETPVPHRRVTSTSKPDYFTESSGNGVYGGSGSSGSERENSFGAMVALPLKTEEEGTDSVDLNRRGSVDERTMTMGRGVRLFVANPDLSD